MIALLKHNPLTSREISKQVGVAKREVYVHLVHIRQSLHREAISLNVLPAECRGCGFMFTKRDRLKRPGRCFAAASRSASRTTCSSNSWCRSVRAPNEQGVVMMKESTFQLIDIFERHFNTKKCGHQETGGHSYNAGFSVI
jgi:predicted Zn-ribbon and HTH transcriptional regulator